jgi:hypothetical protein
MRSQLLGAYSPGEIIDIWRKHQRDLMRQGNWQQALRIAMTTPYLRIGDQEAGIFSELLAEALASTDPESVLAFINDETRNGNFGYGFWRVAIEELANLDPDKAAIYVRQQTPASLNESTALYFAVVETITRNTNRLDNADLGKLAGNQPDVPAAIQQLATALGTTQPARAMEWAAATPNQEVRNLIRTSLLSGAAGVNRPDLTELLATESNPDTRNQAIRIWVSNLPVSQRESALNSLNKIEDVNLKSVLRTQFMNEADRRRKPQ